MKNKLSREQWLRMAKLEIDAKIFKFIKNESLKVKDVHVSFGIPHGTKNAIGQAWHPKKSEDGKSHIFICPSLTEPSRILDVLVHELIHAYVGIEHGHKGAFKKVAKAAGLTGKMTATTAGPELERILGAIVKHLGELTHAGLDKSASTGAKRQKNRHLKLECPCCGYIVRTTKTAVFTLGLPYCPRGTQFELVEKI